MTDEERWIVLGVLAVLFLVGLSLLWDWWRDWFGHDESDPTLRT